MKLQIISAQTNVKRVSLVMKLVQIHHWVEDKANLARIPQSKLKNRNHELENVPPFSHSNGSELWGKLNSKVKFREVGMEEE
jgi:hypothetical protein